jgi:hypothetical protein
MSASTGCTKARPCARSWCSESWCSDVTPFEYMQALTEMWGRAGKDFAAAQQSMFSDVAGQMAKAAGQQGANAALANTVDYQDLAQANAAFGELWSSAAELSATLTRNMQAGDTQDRMVTELLGKIFDPRGWFSSMEGMDQVSFPKIISARIGDAIRTRLVLRRWSRIVGRHVVAARPCPAPGACASRCNKPNTGSGPVANAARRRSRHGPSSRAAASRSGAQHKDSARVTWVRSGGPGCPSSEPAA